MPYNNSIPENYYSKTQEYQVDSVNNYNITVSLKKDPSLHIAVGYVAIKEKVKMCGLCASGILSWDKRLRFVKQLESDNIRHIIKS